MMSFASMFILLLLINFIRCDFNLLVFGDTGQFEEYQAAIGDTSKDSSLFTLNPNTGVCTKNNGSFSGFYNFQSVLTADLYGGQQFICKANQIVILGDISYPEIGSAKLLNTTSAKYSGFKSRLLCMWYVFNQIWKTLDLTKCPATSANPLKTLSSDGRYENLVLITGNHAFDVDYDVETQQMASLVTNKAFFFDNNTNSTTLGTERAASWTDIEKFPSISVRIKDGVRVEFLDLNMYPIFCYLNSKMNATAYSSCFYISKAYGIFYNFADAKVYTEKFILALKSFTTDANWRVIRTHNPVFSVQGTTSSQDQFFSVFIDDKNTTLLDLIETSNVNLFLSSHNHYGQVQIFPYDQLSTLKNKFQSNNTNIGNNTGIYNFDGSVCQLDNSSNCLPTSKCYYDNRFFGGYLNTTDCTPGKQMTIRHNAVNPNNFIVLIVGFSGRKFDAVESDQRTAATVIYDMGSDNGYGGTFITFGATNLTAQFFVGNQTVFTLNTVSGNDNYTVLNAYTNQKISNQLQVVPFNFSQYNTSNNAASSINFSLALLFLAIVVIFI